MLKLLLAVTLLVFVHCQEDTNVEFDVSDDSAAADSSDDASVVADDAAAAETSEDDAEEADGDEADEAEAEDDDDDVEEVVVVIDPPAVTDLKAAQVVLPEMTDGLMAPDVSKCLDEQIYKQSDLIETDNDMLCAFIAFQANKDLSEPGNKVYANREEATMRYGIFKDCVKNVQEINSDKQRSWKAGVNLFCDMTASEKYPYFHGLNPPVRSDDNDAEDGFGRVKKSGMMLGAPKPLGAPRPE